MENREKLSPQEAKIQDLLNRYLSLRARSDSADPGAHIDQDSLSAFVEGGLSERESGPVVGHLVRCSFCRHVTTELVRLDLAFADTPVEAAVESAQPSKVSEVLSGILSRIFGTGEAAVFAHEEKQEEEKADESVKDKESE